MATTTFTELSDDLFDEVLELPIKGRVWRIVSPPAEHGLRISRLVAGAMNASEGRVPSSEQLRAFQFSDEEEELLMHQLLGDEVYTELMSLYSWSLVQHVLMTVIIWVAFDADMAKIYWAAGPKGKPTPNRATRRKKK